MSEGSPEAKIFVDRGVQVGSSEVFDISFPLVLTCESPNISLYDVASSAINISRHFYSTAYTQSSQGSPPLLTAERMIKPPQLPRNRPSSSQINLESTRIVSLPETAPLFSGKRALKGSTRVVSMPEQRGTSGIFSIDSSLSSSDRIDVSVYSGESYTSIEDDNSDSILIIENNGELSEAFLRHRIEDIDSDDESEKGASNDDNGWVTWANSPPRPIPALHGPLSLPYARCPSGAEGTIIEEPENLPRMIWGLETEGQILTHAKSDPYDLHQHTTQGKSLRLPDHLSAQSTPKKQQDDRSALHYQNGRPPASMQRHSQVSKPLTQMKEQDNMDQQQSDDSHVERYPRGLFDDAIVLENLLREDGAARSLWIPGNNSQSEGHHVAPTMETKATSGTAGPPLGRNQRITRADQRYAPANVARSQNTGPGNFSSGFLQSSSSMRVTTRPALGSALPQILIEPRSPQTLQVPARRPSAIEIAQQYRQHHMQKQQGGLLPTPPNSSSPLWSSDFSPYQESAFSPSDTFSQLSGFPVSSSQSQLLNAISTSEQLSRHLQSMNDLALDMGLASLAPAAQINSASRLRVPALNIHNLYPPHASENYLTTCNKLASPIPPAMPFSHELRAFSQTSDPPSRGSAHVPPNVHAPPSPTSPEVVRRRTSSQPQPRSIPLARLMQRRLSAVPEEDSASTVRGHSPSPARPSGALPVASRTRYHSVDASSGAYADARVHLPVSKGQMQTGPSNSRPVPGGLTTQSRHPEQALGDLYGESATLGARVRLPLLPSHVRNENVRQDPGRAQQGGKGKYDGGRGDQREHEAPARGFAGRKKMRGRGRKAFGGPSNPSLKTLETNDV